MKVMINERLVASRARLGKVAAGLGFAVLIAGLIISLLLPQAAYFWVALACLLIGIVVSAIGATNMNRWMREPRADQVIDRSLKGFDDRYRVYHYMLPAAHVLLAPTGLYVLTAMIQDGVIRYQGGRWRRDFSVGRAIRFMADEGLGRPFDTADAEVRALAGLLEKNGLAEGVEIESWLVFVHPRARLVIDDAPRPVILPKELKPVLRAAAGKIAAERYRQLAELFDAQTGPR